MAHNQDNDNLSDDVFEEVEITEQRAAEFRRRALQYDQVPPRNLMTYVDASGSVITDYNVPHQNYHHLQHQIQQQPGNGASTSQQHHSTSHHHRREPHQGHDDGWRSYRYEEVGMQAVQQPQPPQPFDDTISHKTILLGDSGVGKTSYLVKYNTGEFRLGSFSATVGIALTNKIVLVDGTRVKLQIWDTAGQERFRSVTHAYYRDAHALLLLYDVTNRTTFDNIRAWLGEIRYYAQADVVILLIGNKADCSHSERQVKREEGERLAAENNVPFMETSAKSGQNVELSFTAVARQIKHGGQRPGTEGQFNVHDFVRNNSNAPSMCEQCKAL